MMQFNTLQGHNIGIVPAGISSSDTRNKPERNKKYNEVDPKYDFENIKKAISKDTNNNCRADVRNLIDEHSDFFPNNQWHLGKCDATSHRIVVKPGSQTIKLPNRRRPVQDKKIDDLVTKELNTSCHSLYSAPAKLVPKSMETAISNRL